MTPGSAIVDGIRSTFWEDSCMAPVRRRRPHNMLKFAMRDFLAAHGGPASIKEIKAGVEPVVGICPDSSYRSALQDERVFTRVARGVFTVND